MAYRCVAVVPKEADQLFLGQDAVLGKTIHPATYLHVDFAIMDNVMGFVVCDDFVGMEVMGMNMYL